MTDRLNGVYVAFEKDVREDDAEATIAAIKQLRGVLAVEKNVRDYNDWVVRERLRREWGEKIWDILHPKAP